MRRPLLVQEFDRLFPTMMLIHQGNAGAAVEATVGEVRRAWAKSPLFLGGIAPTTFTRSGVTEWHLNQLPQIKSRAMNPGGAQFGQRTANGVQRVQLEPLTRSPQSGYGSYRVHILDPNGRRLTAFKVDLDQEWKGGIPKRLKGAAPVQNQNNWVPVWRADGKTRDTRPLWYIRQHPNEFWRGKLDAQGRPVLPKKGK